MKEGGCCCSWTQSSLHYPIRDWLVSLAVYGKSPMAEKKTRIS